MPGAGDLGTGWGGRKGTSCLMLGGSKLRVQRELGQGLETLLWEKGGIAGEGAGKVTWGGRRGVPCTGVPSAVLTQCVRGPAPRRAVAWASGQDQVLGEAGGCVGVRAALRHTEADQQEPFCMHGLPAPPLPLSPLLRHCASEPGLKVAVPHAGAVGLGEPLLVGTVWPAPHTLTPSIRSSFCTLN